MEIKVISKVENKLMHRKEVAFAIIGEPAVKADSVKTELCKLEGLSPDTAVISRIDQAYGSLRQTGVMHAYESAEHMKRFESRPVLTRAGILEKKAKTKKAAPTKATGSK
jgi:ribosomal protein S24E